MSTVDRGALARAGSAPGGSATAEAGVAGANDRGRPVWDLQLGEHIGHVVADCLLAQCEAVGDDRVAVTGGQEFEDVVLAPGKVGERGCGGATGSSEVRGDPQGERSSDDHLTAGHGRDRPGDLVRIGALEDVATRTGPK